MSQTTAFNAPNSSLFYKSPRSNDVRLGEIAKVICESDIPSLEPGFVLYGYPDDDGIRANFGRLGAREAPDAIRTALYKMTPPSDKQPAFFDLGNLNLAGDLRERQVRGSSTVARVLQAGHRALAMGGGHDYAFSDGNAFLNSYQGRRPLVINFDAHLDVRPDSDGPNSGSGFYQLLTAHQNFDFVEIGLQPHCNSLAHRRWTEQFHKITLLDLSKVQGRLTAALAPFMKMRRPTYLSVDIDVFSSAFAPGASASYATGLDPNEFLPVLRQMAAKMDIRVFGIYEVSPPLDFANKTSQLAAILFHTFLYGARHVKSRK